MPAHGVEKFLFVASIARCAGCERREAGYFQLTCVGHVAGNGGHRADNGGWIELPGGVHAFAEPGGYIFGDNRADLSVTDVGDEQFDGIGPNINDSAAHGELLPVQAVRCKCGKCEGRGAAWRGNTRIHQCQAVRAGFGWRGR